jgi:hypothetical protein
MVLFAAASALLLCFPPSRYAFYPQCPIYQYLHLQCPGCGTTRALAALLHGHLLEALRLNALTTLTIFLVAVYAILCYRRMYRGEPLQWPRVPNAVLYTAFIVTAAFTIARNLAPQIL